MGYADALRAATITGDAIADTIEGIFDDSFPLTFTSWTPTLGVTGGTYGSTSITFAKYIQIGKMVIFAASFTGTTGSAPATITFTLPVTASATGGAAWPFYAQVVDGGSTIAGVGYTSSTTVGTVTRHDAADFGDGASRTMRVFGVYEAA